MQREVKQPAISYWVAFDFYKLETRPPKYGKYIIFDDKKYDGLILMKIQDIKILQYYDRYKCIGQAAIFDDDDNYTYNDYSYWFDIDDVLITIDEKIYNEANDTIEYAEKAKELYNKYTKIYEKN